MGGARFVSGAFVGLALLASGCRTAPMRAPTDTPGMRIAAALASDPLAGRAAEVVGDGPAVANPLALHLGDVRPAASAGTEAECVACGWPADDAVAPAAADAPPPPTVTTTQPPIVVTAPRLGAAPPAFVPSTGRMNDRVGPNNQPVWTTHRRFTTTRAYVLAPWQLEFESWWEGKFKKDGTERHRYLQELEIGLPGRFQFDFYWRVQEETGEETRWEDFQIEGRWALAPWDCIPLNPTLYAEYKFLEGDEPDAWEAKLLLADDIGSRWQWAVNFFFERQTSGEFEEEMGFAAGLSYALFDPCLTVGIEAKYERVTVEGARDDAEVEFLIGPSIQWRPTRRTHLDIAPLFGVTEDSPDVQVWVIFGFDILPGASQHSISAPSSTRGR